MSGPFRTLAMVWILLTERRLRLALRDLLVPDGVQRGNSEAAMDKIAAVHEGRAISTADLTSVAEALCHLAEIRSLHRARQH